MGDETRVSGTSTGNRKHGHHLLKIGDRDCRSVCPTKNAAAFLSFLFPSTPGDRRKRIPKDVVLFVVSSYVRAPAHNSSIRSRITPFKARHTRALVSPEWMVDPDPVHVCAGPVTTGDRS